MNSVGTINTSYIVGYDENGENYENLDNKFIVKVKSSSLDDVIILFKEPNFEKFIHEASNCFIVSVEFHDQHEEEEDNIVARSFNAFVGNENVFMTKRLFILQFNKTLFVKLSLQNKFYSLRSSKIMKMYEKFFGEIKYNGNILDSEVELSYTIESINPKSDDLVLQILKLFDFKEQPINEILKVAAGCKFPIEKMDDVLDACKGIRLGKLEIIAILLRDGSRNYDNEILLNVKRALSSEEQNKIIDEIDKYHAKSLLLKLRLRSEKILSTRITKIEEDRIEKLFEDIINLNHKGILLLLEVVDKPLKIRFEFEKDSINRPYPPQTEEDVGVFDKDRMTITVGAKNAFCPTEQSKEYEEKEWEIKGILIHEICHYVNFMIFNNNCKPYYKSNDEANEQKYKDIVDEYSDIEDHNEIVKRVFTYKTEEQRHAELIVRVVQMIVKYKILEPKILKALERKYEKLFKYFDNVVVPQMKAHLDPVNQLKKEIEENSSSIISDLDKMELKSIMKTLKHDENKCVHLVETNAPKLALANFRLNFVQDHAIFTTFKELINASKAEKVIALLRKNYKIKIVIYCDEKKENFKNIQEFLNKLDSSFTNNHVFIIFDEKSGDITEIEKKFLEKETETLEKINFGFADLTEESKENILKKNVIFQGNNVKLKKIITKDSSAAQFLSINQFLESSDSLIIGKLPEKNADYDEDLFIPRKLNNKTGEDVSEFSTEKIDEILSILSTKQYILISDEVGKGKSTLMTHLAYQFLQSTLPHIDGKFFVIKINLNHYVKELTKFNDDTQLNKFIFENFVKASNFEEFEWRIFEEYCDNKKAILMFDGFDEISPNCETETLEIIKRALNFNFSNVIVATRPFILQKLKSSCIDLKPFILNLMPISTYDQMCFLTKYFKSQNEIEKNFSQAELEELTRKAMQQIHSSVRLAIDSTGRLEDDMLSFPLHLRMFADVICEKILQNKTNVSDAINSIISFNVYHLYREFFQNKERIALENKGEVVRDEIRYLEHKIFKKLQIYDCARKLAWNTLHPTFKANPLKIDSREMKFLQDYGIASIQNDEIYFIHRSYAEFFIADLFLDELGEGSLSTASKFSDGHFLVKVLTLIEHETIKGFINTALSDTDTYKEIEDESFKCLGKFIINEFNKLEGNDKNFLHCIFFHELNERMHRLPRKDYIFVSYLMIDSLMLCNDAKDIDDIKRILQLPWDINNIPEHLKPPDYMYMYTMETGKNLLHLTCEMGVNCFLSPVWLLAKEVFKEDVKEFFLSKSSTSPYDCDYDAVAYAFRCIEHNKAKTNLQKCSTINELRSIKNINILEEIDLNKPENFRKSLLYLIFEIIKELKFSDDEVNQIILSNFHHISKYRFISLNLHFYLLSDFPLTDSKIISNILFNICHILSEIILNISNDIKGLTSWFLNFLKENISDTNYVICIANIFGICLQSNNHHPYINDVKASILYSELKKVYKNNSENLKDYFKNWKNFFNLFKENDFEHVAFEASLLAYFKILDEDHLTLLLLNETPENPNIITKVVKEPKIYLCKDDNIKLLLNLLESRYPDKEKLYYIVDKSHMLEASMLSKGNFPVIFDFCVKNFEKSKIEALLFPPGIRHRLYLENPNVLNTVINLFMETFDNEKWKIFFFQTNENNETIIHELLLNDCIENALKLIEIAKDKLGQEFENFIKLKDKNENSIYSLKSQKGSNEESKQEE